MSGRSCSTCASRSMPLTRSVPSAKPDGSSGSRNRSPPIPAVVLITMSTSLARSRSHHLAVQRYVARPGAGARIPDVHVHDGRPGPGRLDAGLGDLLRGDRHELGPADGVPGTGQRAGDDDLAIHCLFPSRVAVQAARLDVRGWSPWKSGSRVSLARGRWRRGCTPRRGTAASRTRRLRDRAAAGQAGGAHAEPQDVAPGRTRRQLDARKPKACVSHDANPLGII